MLIDREALGPGIRSWCGGILCVLWLALSPATLVHAQASPEVVQRLQSMLQDATRARAALERDKVRLEKEVGSLEKEVKALKRSAARLEQQLASATQQSAILGQEAQATKREQASLQVRFDKVVKDCRESLYQMRDFEIERNRFILRVAERNATLGACIDANIELRDLNEEILQRYESEGGGGLFRAAAEREPFTRLSRVRLENALDDYRFRASDYEVLAPEDLLRADQAGELMIDERWQCTDTRPAPERPPIP